MMKRLIQIIFINLLFAIGMQAQEIIEKKRISPEAWDIWKSIENPVISDDGKWISYELRPYKGDGVLIVVNPERLSKFQIPRGSRANFSVGSTFIVYRIEPQQDTIRKLKFEKAKKEKFPKDSLCIRLLRTNEAICYPNLKSFKMPVEKSDWLAFQEEPVESNGDSKAPKKHKDAPETFPLTVFNPINKQSYQFKDVSEYLFSDDGKSIAFVQVSGIEKLLSKVTVFEMDKPDIAKIFENEGLVKNLTIDKDARQAAFIYSNLSGQIREFSLYAWSKNSKRESEEILNSKSNELPSNWVVSEFGTIWFSANGRKIYFGSALKPEPIPKDTLLDEEKINLDIWAWTDPLLQSQQLVELRREQRRTFLTVFHIQEKRFSLLADEYIKEIVTVSDGNPDVAIGITDSPFQRERSWSFPWFKDVYQIDVLTGNKKIVLEKNASPIGLSPTGRYIFWFENQDSSWYTYNTKTKEKKSLTKKIGVNFYNEEHDRPSVPPSYSFAGWTENDTYFIVYDKFDIWRLDPNGLETPFCITNGFGRKNSIEYRFVNFREKKETINSKEIFYMSAFNMKTMQRGFYFTSLIKKQEPVRIFMEDFEFATPVMAKNAPAMFWRKGSAVEFPDLWYSSNTFKEPFKISRANPQQDEYFWHTAELVRWKTFDGKEEEGILYKPEGFVSWKKYPMIVHFYEIRSDRIHTHNTPRPSQSQLNIIDYTSNGYLVFMPNIRYTIGNPGESAVNYVVSGTKAVIDKGFVDENRIGIQGQSWGGYQTAFIITQTNLFKAAVAFSPVSNMTSAYGEIVWNLGWSRMSMYESDQSRIGSTLWERPELFIQNSPIFYADKIETPLLIGHNDGDGTVPWNQGIALFVALRRLSKPAWLLNYNGESHSIRAKSPNGKDFSIRMQQFFDHYLLGKPAPMWIQEGIPALKKGRELGY
jgi:dienelactone hydrolase